jgi:hypothetical protein
VIEIIAQVRTVTTRDLSWSEVPGANMFLRELDDHIANTMSASPRWVRGMTVLNVLVAGMGVYHLWSRGWQGLRDSTTQSDLAAVALGGTTAVGGVLRLLKMAAADGVGRCLAVAGTLISGGEAIVAFSQGHTSDGVFASISAVGSGLLWASLGTWEVPVVGAFCAVAGGVLVIGSAVASWVWSNRDLFRTDMQRWWVAREDQFQNGAIFTQVAENVPALKDKAAKFLDTITDTAFPLINASQTEALRMIVPPDDFPKLLAH